MHHFDTIINGEIIIDSQFDVLQMDVGIQFMNLLNTCHRLDPFGMINIMIVDTIVIYLLCEIMIDGLIGRIKYIQVDFGDDHETMLEIIGD